MTESIFDVFINGSEYYVVFTSHSLIRKTERSIEISVLLADIMPAISLAISKLKVGDIRKKEEVIFYLPEYKISAVVIVSLIDFVIKTVVLNGYYDGMTSASHGQKIITVYPDGSAKMTVNP